MRDTIEKKKRERNTDIFRWKVVGGVRDEQARLSARPVSNNDALEVLHGCLSALKVVCGEYPFLISF